MLRAWCSPEFRPTMDIDMLGKTSNEETDIVVQIRDVMAVVVEPDGLTFAHDSIKSERITEDADYEGIRVRFRGMLDSARVSMQTDIGFGDIVYPGPEESDLPAMLDFPSPRLRASRTPGWGNSAPNSASLARSCTYHVSPNGMLRPDGEKLFNKKTGVVHFA